jgi:ligand-binding sensor domain-containing protein
LFIVKRNSIVSCNLIKKGVLFTALIFYALLSLSGQNSSVASYSNDYYTQFTNYTRQHGLSSNKILDIVQDQCGFIWIATNNGLNRFDGYRFISFLNHTNDSLSISDNYITSLCVDERNNLWVGTKNGLNCYDREKEHFVRFPVQNQNKKGISHAHVRKILTQDASNLLWVETNDGVLNKIELNSKNVSFFKHDASSTDYYDYHALTIDNEGTLWLGGRDFGPYQFDTTLNTMKLLKADNNNPQKKRDNDVACIYQDAKNRIWISGTDGFYRYFKNKDTFSKKLPASTFEILSDTDTTLWLATGNGLYKYLINQNHFIRFQNNIYLAHTIINNHINCLFTDRSGNLWTGTNKGISVLQPSANQFRHYRSVPGINHSLLSNHVSCFFQDSKDQVWIGTMGKGVHRWNPDSYDFSNFQASFPDKRVSTIFEDSQGTLYFGLWSGEGFYSYQPETNKFYRHALDYSSLKSDWYNAFYEDAKDRLWVGFWGSSGVHFFNRKTLSFELYSLRLYESPATRPINHLISDGTYLWMNYYYGILHRFNPATLEFESFYEKDRLFVFPEWKATKKAFETPVNFGAIDFMVSNDSASFYFLSEQSIYQWKNEKLQIADAQLQTARCISNPDSAGNFYFATNKQINYYNNNSHQVSEVLTPKNLPAQLKLNQIKQLFIVQNQDMYINTNNNFWHYNLNEKKFTILPSAINSVKTEINTLNADRLGNLYLATNQGLYVINRSTNKITHYCQNCSQDKNLPGNYVFCSEPQTASSLVWLGTNRGLVSIDLSLNEVNTIKQTSHLEIKQLFFWNSDSLYLGTNQGLMLFNTQNNTLTPYNQFNKHQLSSHLVQFIFEDVHGFIWVGTTNNGLNQIDTNQYTIKHYSNQPGDSLKFWGNHASCIYQSPDSILFVGGTGINIYDYKKKQFRHLTKNMGLSSDKILGITGSNDSIIWITTPESLVKYNYKANKFKSFGSNYGLEPEHFTDAILTLKNNKVLIGSENGFYVFSPEQIQTFSPVEKMGLTGFYVFDKVRKIDFSAQEEIVLSYKENFFTLEFSNFDFMVQNTRFYYRLVGIDENWVATQSNQASYTNIAPGRYIFEVNTQQGIQKGSPSTSIAISILPPYWQRTWFILLEVLAVMAVLLFIYRQRIKQFVLREKSMKLEQTLLRSEMDPHFVFNALIAIQSFIFKNEAKEAGRYLSKFAKLMRLFLQNTRHEFIPLNQEIETLVYYTELQRLRFNNSFDCSIQCIDNIDTETIAIPPMMAQPFIENAIEHGFKGISYPGIIKINYQVLPNFVLINIEDNGVGFKQSIEKSKNKKHHSLALTITRERLANFSTKKLTFDIELTDLSDLNQLMHGTRIAMKIPYKKL